MNDFCSLWSEDAMVNNLNMSLRCWRGECIVCGFEKERRKKRIEDLRQRGLTQASEAEVQAFLKKNEGVLSRKAVAYIETHGLRYYTVRRN